MAARKEFIDEIRPRVTEISSLISSGADLIEISYKPRLAVIGPRDMISFLKKERERDIKMGATLYGPHRDIIDIVANQTPIKEFGSMGQKKTVMLAMKIAALGALSAHRGEPAILILDEAFAVLDNQRERRLLELLSGRQDSTLTSGGQVFLATAVATELDARNDVKIFEVKAGSAMEKTG
jgi:DNA replication and repair protein RecF